MAKVQDEIANSSGPAAPVSLNQMCLSDFLHLTHGGRGKQSAFGTLLSFPTHPVTQWCILERV